MRNTIESLLAGIMIFTLPLMAQDAREIVDRAYKNVYGKSSYSELTMTIVKPDWSRKISMKMWAIEPDYAMILVTAPARDKGTVTLKRKNEIWNWIPRVQRVIKIPPSMMLQSWMGSDFTNDDLVRESSIVNDYQHTLMGQDTVNGELCYRIHSLPKPEAAVVWGKLIHWITQKTFLEVKIEFYDEDGNLVKTMFGTRIRKMGGRLVPTHYEMIPHDKPGQKTVLDYQKIQFNIKLKPSFFSLQNMKRLH